MIKRILAVTLTLCLLVFLAPAAAFAAEGDVTVTILHTNDIHGRTALDPYLAKMVDDKEAAGENILVLDAGDRLHGQITANLSKGMSMVELMNEVGYDAMTLGNHDFSYGLTRLNTLARKMDFPILDANVYDADGERLFAPYQIFEFDGVKVGVFGLTTPESRTKADPKIVGDLKFDYPVREARGMIRILEAEDCDVIVALTHLGDDKATLFNEQSTAIAALPGVDVIIDGHSHTLLETGKTIGDALVASTGEHGANIGMVTLTISGDTLTKTAALAPIPAEGVESDLLPDESVLAMVAAEDAKVEPITSVVVGSTPALLNGDRAAVRSGETNMANLITDSLRDVASADIAFVTGGNIRESIPAGDVTMGDVLSVLPFSNLAVSVNVTGETVMAILEHGVSLYPEEAGQHIQVSGLSFTFNPAAAAGSRVTSVTMADGSELDPAKTYVLATLDFLASGGDGYAMLADATGMKYYGDAADVLAAYIGTSPAISAEPEGRVKPE